MTPDGGVRRWATVACAAVLLAACSDSGDGTSDVDRAKARVEAKQKALDEATKAAEAAAATFCDQGATYLAALDRYGDVLHASTATVGDVRDAGTDLAEPQQDVLDAGEAAVGARDDVVSAEQELADAKAELAEAKGGSPKPAPSSSATAVVPEPPQDDVQRVRQAAADLDDAVGGITEDTPLVQASQQLNAAAVALEMSWLRLLADVGCLTDAQQAQAESAVHDYTVALQQALSDAGYYDGKVDGVYGPATVDAVEALQTAHDLPVTGVVDTATEAALEGDLVAAGGVQAKEATASTAALQQTLKLAGYWSGPVDGEWTPALTDALKKLQRDLGVKQTGSVDAATLAALEQAVATVLAPSPSPSGTPGPAPSESAPSVTSTATAGSPSS